MTTKEIIIAIGAESLICAITTGLIDYCHHKQSINGSIFYGLTSGVFYGGLLGGAYALGYFSEEKQRHTEYINERTKESN